MLKKRRRREKPKKKLKWFICFVLAIAFTVYGLFFVEEVVAPAIDMVAEVEARAVITKLISDAVEKRFDDSNEENLLHINTDSEGNITMIQPNDAMINQLSAGLISDIQTAFDNLKPSDIKVPVGTILGSQILSQFTPNMQLKVLPIGVAEIAFKTSFEDAGINQTKYKVSLEVSSQAKIIVPFSQTSVSVKTTVPVTEAVIVGKVPNTYISVPENKILDATDIAH